MTRLQIALLFVLAAANFVGCLPSILGFDHFAFGDMGWALTVDVMLADDQIPVTDFGYFYGLLTLLFDRAMFLAVGRTPQAIVGLYAICALAVAIGIVRTARAANLDRVSGVYLAICAPLMVMPILFPSPAHAIEAALLANALAYHAGGRLGKALVLVTVTVFVKPSLGYVYGLILLVLILVGWPEKSGRWKRLLPATGVGLAILATLITVFGWEPVIRTQLPFDGMRAYKDSGFGFLFGSGRKFWIPQRPDPFFYLLTPAGVWLASSAVLIAAAIRLLPRARQLTANLTVTCLVLHLMFVFVLFGNQWSWIYYSYILFVGAAVGMSAWKRAGVDPTSENPPPVGAIHWVGIALIGLAGLGQLVSVWPGHANMWSITRRSPSVAGLFSTPAEAKEWAAVRELAKSERVFVLTRMGCTHLISPEIDAPRSWCLTQATATPAELERVRAQIRAAQWIVVPNWHDNDLLEWPEFADEVRPFQKAHEIPLYSVYRRQP